MISEFENLKLLLKSLSRLVGLGDRNGTKMKPARFSTIAIIVSLTILAIFAPDQFDKLVDATLSMFHGSTAVKDG